MREGGALDVAVRAPEGEHEPEDPQRKRARVFRARAEEALEDHGLRGERAKSHGRRRRPAARDGGAQHQQLHARSSDVAEPRARGPDVREEAPSPRGRTAESIKRIRFGIAPRVV